MTVRILDLQLIYGVAGAREQFERLARNLIKSEYPTAAAVRVKKGDDGIDVYVGEWSDKAGIDIFQCKFFPLGLGQAQKAQIQKSFRTCMRSKKFTVKKWILCLPTEMSSDEITWFESWKTSQGAGAAVIKDVWSAEKLEKLLYEEKNRGIKEAFFKEEHLKQIRELHQMLPKLVMSVEKRLFAEEDDREKARKLDSKKREAEYLDQYMRQVREDYAKITKPGGYSTPVVQQLVRAGLLDVGRAYINSHKRLGHWEVVIRPSVIPEAKKTATINRCQQIVGACQVQTAHWSYPHLTGGRKAGHDWVGLVCLSKQLTEYWQMSQRHVFAHLFPIFSDAMLAENPLPSVDELCRGAVIPPRILNWDEVIIVITHILRFARNLAAAALGSDDPALKVSVGLTGTMNRPLVLYNFGFPVQCGRATQPTLSETWEFKRDVLRDDADLLAADVALWFYEQFNWEYVTAEKVKQLQQKALRGA